MATTAAILPAELIAEIISLLPVKSLMKFICVNKFFKTLISDDYFVQLHLKKSSPNSHLALMWRHNLEDQDSSLQL
ncbi:F-box protein, partial [Trifolium medium]|nr:F-box protein [Trifolium medium]